jgi:hypothetical protein
MAGSLVNGWRSCRERDEPARTRGARALRFRRVLTLLMVGGVAGPALGQAGGDERWPTPTAVEITLVGPEAAVAPVRQVTLDLLSRDGVALVWRQADKLRVEDVVEAPVGGRGGPVVVWVDVSSGAEARIYFRAAAGQRFVIRRVSLPGGVALPAAEEIAQIIQSVLRALAADTAWALSLSEARVALSVPERRPPPAAPPAPARATVVEIGPALAGQLYAPGLPFVGDLEVAIAALSRPAMAMPSVSNGSWGGRIVLGYGLPVHFATGAVGADLRTAKLRLALVWEPWRQGRVAIRLALGGGADRIRYSPTAELPGAMAAAGGSFVSALGCADVTLRLEVSPRLVLGAGVLAEIALQRVHFDAYDADGNLAEVLVPHRVRPGIRIGLEVRL